MEKFSEVHQNEQEGKEIARAELDGYLSEVDMERIHTMFTGFAKEYGIDNPNLLDAESIFPISEGEGLKSVDGAYEISENSIYLNTRALDLYPKDLRATKFLLTLVHESTHALASRECIGGFSSSGLQRTFTLSKYFESFNEAITEKNARILTDSYLINNDQRGKLKRLMSSNSNLAYVKEVWFLESFTNLLSRETGVSVETVERAITNDYLHGTDLLTHEIRTEFQSIFYESSLMDMASIDEKTDLSELFSKFKNKDKTIFQRIVDKLSKE